MAEPTNPDDLKRLARQQRQSGALKGAADSLRLAIGRAGLELADLYGMLGGTLRDQGDLVGAAAAYDAGFELEKSFASPTTYNELNRLVLRVQLALAALANPDVLRARAELAFVDVARELAGLEAKLQRDLGGARAGNPWAAGDLAVTAALNGHLALAREAVERFTAASPPPAEAALAAYARTLAALAALDTPSRKTL